MGERDRKLAKKFTGTMRWYNRTARLALIFQITFVIAALFFLVLILVFTYQYKNDIAIYGSSEMEPYIGEVALMLKIFIAASVLLAALLSIPSIIFRRAYRRNQKKYDSYGEDVKSSVSGWLARNIEAGRYGHRCMHLSFFADCGGERRLEFLVGLLKSGKTAVRLRAVRALASLGDCRAVEPVSALQKDKSARVCREAGRAVSLLREMPGNYTTIPYTSFTSAMKALNEHGKPIKVAVQKAEYNEFMDVVLTFEDGYRGIFGGFAKGEARNDTRANLLNKLLEAAGCADAEI